MTAKQTSRAGLVRMLCALALLMVGFAHKVPALDYGPIPLSEIAHYTLPDGSLPMLCLSSEHGDTKHGSHDLGSGCEACRLSASVLLPAPPDTVGERIQQAIAHFRPLRSEAHYRQLFPPNTSPRGPPSGLLT
ncbi:hypothetical protein [Ferirhizobium litorale]|uniref:DUF2946 domain-containing protein n=1 Tax=Ferirhizobium litorale TaxID=2927786 RepID=A0AAE3QFY0_9HYPH|nr:hypothetical protein [Fererhizobium litorale]MDI7922398.1 hypothetical protein [Fererhizobium litorale]